MKKITYLDTEWANSKNKSICQMGILCEDFETDELLCEKDYKINPEDDFDVPCEQQHHITAKMVSQEKTFPQVWNEVKEYFVDSIVVGYNVAGADLDALTKYLQRYNLAVPELIYIDLGDVAKKFICDAIENHQFKTVCNYFNIEMHKEHDAFWDAHACRDLFRMLRKRFQFDIGKFTREYVTGSNFVFESYITSTHLNQAIKELYGVIQGISLDETLSNEEITYISNWKEENKSLVNYRKVAGVFNIIDTIVDDKVVTREELSILDKTMKDCCSVDTSAELTRATQILQGILKGIACDKIISVFECNELKNWLFEHEHLAERYPFNEIIRCLKDVLQDNIITQRENEQLLNVIDEILHPSGELTAQACSVSGRKVCLTGEFKHGSKSKVENYITERGGIICKDVTKKLDILIIGDMGSSAYAYGEYGNKVRKAKEYNRKNYAKISIMSEEEFFSKIK